MKSEEKAEMFYSMLSNNYASVQDLQEILIGFAKYHVLKALNAAHSSMQLPKEDLEFTLNSYNLNNIQ